jgi:glucokinase
MFLGIEIGGTKLQLAIGAGNGSPPLELERIEAESRHGAEEIRRQIAEAAHRLLERHAVQAIGIGFGGPVDATSGETITSHQVAGWDRFPIADWCRRQFGLPVVLSNDSDAAGLAEARFGGGRGRRIVFYTNVGSGVGGALVIEGRVYGGAHGVASELGHLRPGPEAERPDQTVESEASGWGIAQKVRRRLLERQAAGDADADDLLRRCQGRAEELTAKIIAQAALAGNPIAAAAFDRACRVFGWAVAQMATLLAPEVVVVGGGVSLVGEELFLTPVRRCVDRYVFPPLKGTFQVVPAVLGEQVVIHGALALAAELQSDGARG